MHGVTFHHFHNGHAKPVQGSLTADALDKLLHRIGIEKILPAKEWLARFDKGESGDHICLTFDDALRSQYDIAKPVLDRYGFTGFWFVYSSVFCGEGDFFEVVREFRTRCFEDVDEYYDAFYALMRPRHPDIDLAKIPSMKGFAEYLRPEQYPFYSAADRIFRFCRDYVLGIDRFKALNFSLMEARSFDPAAVVKELWLDNDILRELDSEDHVIGLHSYSHPTFIASLPIEDQRLEYRKNAEHLGDVLGYVPDVMAHPNGSYDQKTLDLLEDMGVRIGFASDMAPTIRSDLALPRKDHMIYSGVNSPAGMA